MAFVDSAGWNIWYEVQGNGPPLTLCGGPIMLHDQFGAALPALNQHFRTISWNWRGAGNSDRIWMRGIRFDDWIDDLVRVLDAAGVDKTDFWCISTGSLFAIRFAARYPHRVGKLVLHPAIGGSSPDFARFTAEMAAKQGIDHLIWNGFWLAASQEAIESGRVAELALHEMELARRNMPAEIFERVNATYIDLDLSVDVTRLTAPVLLLLGASGRLGAAAPIMAGIIDKFRVLCPRAEFVSIPGAGGTLSALEQPDASVAAVRAFLNRDR